MIVPSLCSASSDEEIGSLLAEPHRTIARESVVLVLEGGLADGSLKTWRKGVGEFRVKVHGRAAHAGGDHEKGRNAIEEMAHQVIAIQGLTDYSKQTTLNVGVIRGGTVSNVVPEEASIQVDVRVMQSGEWERLEDEMKKLKPVLDGTSIAVSGQLNRPPMPFDETMKATCEKASPLPRRGASSSKRVARAARRMLTLLHHWEYRSWMDSVRSVKGITRSANIFLQTAWKSGQN
jgi:glutamate carboxypeptidase